MTIDAYIQGIQDRVRDIEERIAAREWEACLIEALAVYDGDAPLELLATTTGAGTSSLTLPTGWSTDWTLLSISSVYEELSGSVLVISGTTVTRDDDAVFTSGETYTFYYRRPRTVTDVASIPSAHCAPVMDMAAAKACRRLAAVYMKTRDQSLGAELITFQRKWEEHLKLADVYEAQYARQLTNADIVGANNLIAQGFVSWSTYS